MEQYLRRRRLGSVMDEIGLRALIALGSVLWFVWLWGLGMPALLAGLALGLMGQMALTRWRRRVVERREQALRKQLGGEMLLEDMLLQTPRRAHFQAAMLLGQRYPLRMERVTEEGMLCQSGGERLLVSCLRRRAPEAMMLLCAVGCFLLQGMFSFSICLVSPMFWAVCGMASAWCAQTPRPEE